MSASPERRMASKELLNPQHGGIDRRQFLQSVMSATVALSVRQLCAQEPVSALETSNINDRLESFPKTIPGIGDRQLKLTKGASRGLIVIEQIHWSRDLSRETAQAVELCQKQIYKALSFLIHGKWIHTIYSEGIMADGEGKADPAYSQYVSADEQKLQGIDEVAEIGAEHVLAEKGLLRIKGAERKATYDQAGKDQDNPNPNIWRWSVLEAREDALSGIAAESNDTIATTVFGSAHKFGNNVWSWNRGHIDKFSLLTLTPEMIARNRKEGRADSDLPPIDASAVAAGS